MNRKRIICGIIAATMLMPSYTAFAGMKGSVKGSVGETRMAGSTSTGTSYDALSEKYDLTIDQAVTDAIAFSRDLKNLEENIDIAEDNEKVVRNAWASQNSGETVSDYATTHSYAVQLRQLANTLSNYSANEEIAKQKIEYNIRSLFYSIKEAEDSLALYDEQIDIQARQLKVYETMLNLGKLSQVEYNDYKQTYDTLVSDKKAVETQISSAYRSLNQLMGKDINQQYNIIVDDLTFTEMGDVSLDYEINKAIATNQTVKEAEDSVNLNKYSLDSFVDGSTVSSDRTQTENNYAQSTRTLEDTKTSLKAEMTSLYENIREAERTYRDNEASLANMEEQLKVKETQYSLGKITELELDAYKLSIDSLKNTMETAVYDHDIMVRQFQNSNLIM